MRASEFVTQPTSRGPAFVRERNAGLIWHRVEHRVLYADTDRSQVVHHANYLRYFELGRASVLRDLGFPYCEVEEDGYYYPIVDLAMRFLHPFHYDDRMWVHTRPKLLERVCVTFEYAIARADGGVLAVTGYTRHCALNPKGTVVQVDPKTTRAFARFPTEGDP
jgi:acyl-CoA thioester hydrolase